MPRVRLRFRGELTLLKVAPDAAWPAVLASVRERLGIPAAASLSLAVGGAKVTSADDLEDNDELTVVLCDGEDAAPSPAPPASAPPTPAAAPPMPPLDPVAAAAAKKAAKKARQKAAKAATKAAQASDPDDADADDDADVFPLVALDTANIGHCAGGLRGFSWAHVAATVAYYARRGVRAVPVR